MSRRPVLAASRRSFVLPVLAVLLAVPALLAPGCAPPGGDGSPTLVTLGSRRISVADYEAHARDPRVVAGYKDMPDSLARRQLLDDLLSYELFAEAAIRQGLDKDTAYAKVESEMMPRLLPDALYDAKISAQVKASDAEARLFHEKQKLEYELGVLMTPDSTSMHSLLARLAKGEPFADVARTGSQDPTTASLGGRINGWVTIGQLPPDVETAVAPLKKGERTGIVLQRTGVYVFQVFDLRERKDPPPFDANKEQVRQALEQRKRGAIVDDYLTGLRKSHQLSLVGPGWDVVDGRFLTMSDSLATLAVLDPTAAGISPEDQKKTLATWKGRTYTIADLFAGIRKADAMERPPLTRDDAVRLFVEGQAMNEILVAEAKAQRLDRSPNVLRQVKTARAAWLVNRYLEKNFSAETMGAPSAAELDSVTNAMIQGMGGTGGAPAPKFADLPPVIQQQIVGDWTQKKRQALLKTAVDKLKADIKPVVDEKVFAKVAWPVAPVGA